jgi:hypothetical protein
MTYSLNWTTLQKVFSLEDRLANWRKALPDTLALPISPEVSQRAGHDPSIGRLKTILWLRYNSVRTLLHRVVIEGLLGRTDTVTASPGGDDQADPLHRLNIASVDICVDSAMESLNTLYQAAGTQDLLPAWWYSIYYSKLPLLFIVLCDEPSRRIQLLIHLHKIEQLSHQRS